MTAHKAALQRSLAAKQLVAQRQLELSQTNALLNAKAHEAARKNLMIAQEERHAASKEKNTVATGRLAAAKPKLLREKEKEKRMAGGKIGNAPVITSLTPEMQAGFDAARAVAKTEQERNTALLQRDMDRMAEEENLRFADALKQRLSGIDGYYRERIEKAKGNEAPIASLTESKEKEKTIARKEYARGETPENDLDVAKARINSSAAYFKYEADRRRLNSGRKRKMRKNAFA
jgi:hypothetical protein